MAILNAQARELLESGALVHFVTVNPDGSPQVSCIWAGLDGDEIVSGHLHLHKKLRNLATNPRVALSIQAPALDAHGLDQYLVVHGTARVEEGGAREVLQRLAHVYMGPDVVFPPPEYPGEGWRIRVTPESVTGNGPWK